MTNVYFNHDGGVDDLVSLLLLLQMPEARVTGVSVVDLSLIHISEPTRHSGISRMPSSA